jgi:high-affinity Fe2+/Pb2+ permease
MVMAFPLLGLPVVAAYLARHFLGSQVVFAAGLAVAAVVGVAGYRWAMRIAARRAERARETLLAVLIPGGGPVAG